jgi:hypothetical protein
MVATSQTQQKFMGMVHAFQTGEMKGASSAVRKAASSMSMKSAKDFASTKRKGLPQHAVMTAIRNKVKKKIKK